MDNQSVAEVRDIRAEGRHRAVRRSAVALYNQVGDDLQNALALLSVADFDDNEEATEAVISAAREVVMRADLFSSAEHILSDLID
jgi:hypothetical protein